MGMFVVPLPPVEIGIALSVLVLGSCIALSVQSSGMGRMPHCRRVRSVFTATRMERKLPSAADPISYSAGFVLATGLLHVSGICLGYSTTDPMAS